MRDLAKAVREGPEALLVSLAGLPHRHPLAISGALIGAVLALLFAGVIDSRRDISRTTTRVTRINRAICDQSALSHPERARRCAQRIRIGLINCRVHPACRAAFLANLRPPEMASTKGVMQQNPSPAGQQPPPAQAGGKGGGGHHHATHHPKSSPTPIPQPTTPTSPAPDEPGNSNESPGHTGENPGQSDDEPPGQSGANHGNAGLDTELCTILTGCVGIQAHLP